MIPALRWNLLAVLAVLLAGCGFLSAGSSPATYGAKQNCPQGRTVAYPDFSIQFQGTRRVTMPQYPRGFLYYDYEVTAGPEKKTVSWTGGTGALGPVEFQIAGKKFLLERAFADKFGKLADAEIVITAGGFSH